MSFCLGDMNEAIEPYIKPDVNLEKVKIATNKCIRQSYVHFCNVAHTIEGNKSPIYMYHEKNENFTYFVKEVFNFYYVTLSN